MSVVRMTYQCDWPGCGKQIDVANKIAALADEYWEHRNLDQHVCDTHRFKTSKEIGKAIRATWDTTGDRQ